ncbi:MAG: helix-turn-helix domain-containing protein, partial [Litoreibacter sp.]|nr:helix-turn-helix domain-containing protein [Litoreibacter sp.]
GTQVGAYTQVDLPMSRSDIADFLGLTTETVSRTITQLRKCEIIALENVHTVVVLKPRALVAMAEGD